MARAATIPTEQATLDLGIERGVTPDIREAYDNTRLAELGYSLDAALAIPHIRVPLENIARALASARAERRA